MDTDTLDIEALRREARANAALEDSLESTMADEAQVEKEMAYQSKSKKASVKKLKAARRNKGPADDIKQLMHLLQVAGKLAGRVPPDVGANRAAALYTLQHLWPKARSPSMWPRIVDMGKKPVKLFFNQVLSLLARSGDSDQLGELLRAKEASSDNRHRRAISNDLCRVPGKDRPQRIVDVLEISDEYIARLRRGEIPEEHRGLSFHQKGMEIWEEFKREPGHVPGQRHYVAMIRLFCGTGLGNDAPNPQRAWEFLGKVKAFPHMSCSLRMFCPLLVGFTATGRDVDGAFKVMGGLSRVASHDGSARGGRGSTSPA